MFPDNKPGTNLLKKQYLPGLLMSCTQDCFMQKDYII